MFIMIRERVAAGPGIIVASSVRPVTFARCKINLFFFSRFFGQEHFSDGKREGKKSAEQSAQVLLLSWGASRRCPTLLPLPPLAALETVAKGNWRERGKLWMRLLQPLADCQFHSRRRPRSIVSHSLLSLLSLSLLFLFISPFGTLIRERNNKSKAYTTSPTQVGLLSSVPDPKTNLGPSKFHWRIRAETMADETSSASSAFSPLSGGYLLIVLSEPHSEQHKQVLLEHLAKGQFIQT
jgi:hypothetical protein